MVVKAKKETILRPKPRVNKLDVKSNTNNKLNCDHAAKRSCDVGVTDIILKIIREPNFPQ